MCGRFTLRTPASVVAKYFKITAQTQWQMALRYNIAPTQTVPVIRQNGTDRELAIMKWGFVPSWAKDDKFCPINAKSETVAEKPMYRAAIKKRRCLVPADGFYEWRKLPKKIKGDAPWYFQVHQGEPFAFAGIWEQWDGSDPPIESCAILTTTPNELMAPLHDRLPVILSPADYDAWLDPMLNEPEKLKYMYEPFPASEMSMFQVSAYVNKSENIGPACLEPLAATGN